MHELYAALAVIRTQRPRTRRDAVREEDEFYESMAKASRVSRAVAWLVARIRASTSDFKRKAPQAQRLRQSQSQPAGTLHRCGHLKSVQ